MNTSLVSHFVPLQASPAGLLGRFAPSGFSKKKWVSIDSKWSKTHKNAKKFLPLCRALRSLRYARSATLPTPAVASLPRASRSHSQALRSIGLCACASWSLRSLGLRARYLPHVTPRVQRSVHAKVHADWTKTVGARGIHTHRHTHRQTDSPSFII